MKPWAFLLPLGLAACATAQAPARAPTAISCVPANLGPAPADMETKESLRAIADPAERYVRLAADWARRAERMAETEAVIADCRKASGA